MLPIWVGAYEANAIALEIEKIAPPRPMTHDRFVMITELGVQVERVVVDELARQHVLRGDRNAQQRRWEEWCSTHDLLTQLRWL